MENQKISDAMNFIDKEEDAMVDALRNAIAIPALSPEKGGEGELKKIEYLETLIKKFDLADYAEITRYDTPVGYMPDTENPERKSEIVRPNLIIKIKGDGTHEETKWGLAHVDIVDPGNPEKWDSTGGDPYKLTIKGRDMHGRGVEDNGQSMISLLFAVKAMKEHNIIPKYNVNVAFVSDEETQSDFGFKYLLKQDIFKKGDMFLVPDFGEPTGATIEIAEKSIVHMDAKFMGKQVHGSVPGRGVNPTDMADDFSYLIRKRLYEEFSNKNELFGPQESTFEATSVIGTSTTENNIIPEENLRKYDFRILPEYDAEDVMKLVEKTKEEIIDKYTNRTKDYEFTPGIEINARIEKAGPATPQDSRIVDDLSKSIKEVYGVETKTIGIGGGTFGGIIRKYGFDAAVWSKIYENAHEVNEKANIDNLVNDAKVFTIFFSR
ncbi:MAG: M20 family metallo-hydrolase [Candidatus Aenigmarchaeota archaeon]|nr:M20 family metallo-hydrolase [Candidatus Aenigmarchaeota archaeon]